MEKMRNENKILIGKFQGKRPLGDLGTDERIKRVIKEISHYGSDWIK
jgi:hypothetical protein